ncbi:PsbP-related protein [Paenibacillus lentus]|uniref:PsbP-related protein n=1 Tax=Paenibacillus lentus TaxID=1338368 RepID=UPI00364F086A
MKKSLLRSLLILIVFLVGVQVFQSFKGDDSKDTAVQLSDNEQLASLGSDSAPAQEHPTIKDDDNIQEEMALTTYVNERYGFSIEYPKAWNIQEDSPSGDGTMLYKENGDEIRVYGGYLLGEELDRLEINEAISEGIDIKSFKTYKGKEGSFIQHEASNTTTIQYIVYGETTHCHLYAKVSTKYYEMHRELFRVMAESIVVE